MFAFMISRLAETRQMLWDWPRKVTLQDLPRAARRLVNEEIGKVGYLAEQDVKVAIPSLPRMEQSLSQ
jgi:hypothetical protein